jgi:hypothetical protein
MGLKLGAHLAGNCWELPHSFLIVTFEAKKSFVRRGKNLYHNLLSTTGADNLIGSLEPPLFVILPGKVSPSSGHIYPLIRMVIHRITSALAQGEAPGFLYLPEA